MKNYISTKISDYIYETKNTDDLEMLFNIAKKFDNPVDFDDYLNHNKINHNREYSFLRERFLRLNRGNRLIGNNKIYIYRTGDIPIRFGDYIYLDYNDVENSFKAGQGNKIYQKLVPESDIIQTSVENEYYYSPKNIAKIGDDLYDLWNYVHGIKNDKESKKDDLKNRIKLFKNELKKLKGVYNDYNEFENKVFDLAKEYNVPIQDYEKYFYK